MNSQNIPAYSLLFDMEAKDLFDAIAKDFEGMVAWGDGGVEG